MNPFKEYFIDTFKNRFGKLDGRARRSEYWYFTLFFYLILITFYSVTEMNNGLVRFLSGMVTVTAFLVMSVAKISVTVRRLHDTGLSGGYYFISFIPLIGSLIMLIFLCQDSNPNDNKYGPNPKIIKIDITDQLIDK